MLGVYRGSCYEPDGYHGRAAVPKWDRAGDVSYFRDYLAAHVRPRNRCQAQIHELRTQWLAPKIMTACACQILSH